MNEPRPNPTTMEGMIYNANEVLGEALKPGINGMPKKLFEKCAGIVICHTVKAGFIFSGTVGSGIAMKKLEGGGWSPPCAVGVGGIGFGLLLGASASDLIIFCFDEETMKAFSKKHGATLAANVELTVGPFGREAQLTDTFTKGDTFDEAVGTTATLAYSKGIFGGFSATGAKIGTRDFINNKYYSATTSGDEILFKPDSVTPPHLEHSLLPEVYDKLAKLEAGTTAEPDAAEEVKKQAAKEAADKAAESVKNAPEAEVVKVDAAAEAAKES